MRWGDASVKSRTATALSTAMTTSAFPFAGTTLTRVTDARGGGVVAAESGAADGPAASAAIVSATETAASLGVRLMASSRWVTRASALPGG
jgi:hypothetical protein